MGVSTHPDREHAVVLGGSMAGLFAARVLAEFYGRVTVLDRDRLPGGPVPRRCVPQDRHLHVLLSRGTDVHDDLFPGLADEMVEHGAVRADPVRDALWCPNGFRLRTAESGLRVVAASRPFLEAHVRERVAALARVAIRPESEATGLVAEAGRVRGVRVKARSDGAEEIMEADLIVDATGRGSRAPAWLEALGFCRPPEDKLDVGIGYSSCSFRVAPEVLHGRLAVIHPATAANPRGGVAQVIEGGRVLVGLSGYRGHHPPSDPAGFLAHAASLTHPEIHEIVARGEPLEPIASHRVPTTVRRRYERLSRFPEGFLVTGDAICAFNPVYAQGMSVAGLEALALRRCLRSAGRDPAPAFFRDAARVVDGPWTMAASGDLEIPSVEGRRPFPVKAVNAWLRRLHAAAQHDASLALAFLRVANLVDPPASLFSPRVAFRVLARRSPRAVGRGKRGRDLSIWTASRV
jgi:2-polyprenyl-6-methoxyphenol hydroxylase-like FAD-dependent oxidoreductase